MNGYGGGPGPTLGVRGKNGGTFLSNTVYMDDDGNATRVGVP